MSETVPVNFSPDSDQNEVNDQWQEDDPYADDDLLLSFSHDLPTSLANPRLKFTYKFEKDEIVWIVDDLRVWAGVILENRELHSCKVKLQGYDYVKVTETTFGYCYIYPYDTRFIQDLEIRRRVVEFRDSNTPK